MTPRPNPARTVLLAAVLAAATFTPAGLAQPKPAAEAAPRAFNAVPGPDAEYLVLADRYTLNNDGSVVHERRSRLQVNSYLAINRKYGESKVDYDPGIEAFEVVTNRTVLPSGQVVTAPANAVVDDQPAAAQGNPLWNGLRRKIIVHTALEPGAVIEEVYRITLKAGALPWFELSEPLAAEIPIGERVVEWDLPESAGSRLASTVTQTRVLPSGAPKGDRTVWTWRHESVAPIPDEPGASPRSETAPYLWASTCSWNEAAAEFARRVEAAGPAPEGALAAVRRAMANETAWEARLLAGLAVISTTVNLSPIPPSLQHWRLRPLADVWNANVATTLELATLEAKALSAHGFTAQVALLGPALFNSNTTPGFTGFDRAVVRVVAGDGSVRLYDPAEPASGGPLEARVASPLLVAGASGLEKPNALAPFSRDLTVAAEVRADGTIAGSLALVASGAATPHAALVRDPAKLTDELVRGAIPAGKAKPPQVTALGRLHAAVDAAFEGKLPEKNDLGLVRLGVTGVPGGLEKDLPPLPAAGRLAPIALPGPGSETEEVTLTLPEGWRVAALPSPVRVANAVGSVEVTATQGPGAKVRIVRRLAIAAAVASAEQAAQVRELLVAAGSPASRELLLAPPGQK